MLWFKYSLSSDQQTHNVVLIQKKWYWLQLQSCKCFLCTVLSGKMTIRGFELHTTVPVTKNSE